MRKIETVGIGIVFGMVPVITCFVAGWWGSIPFVQESRIPLFAVGGLGLGILIDAIFLKGWIRRAYSVKPLVWKSLYVFYAIGMFGFFMGVPVFHVLLGIPAGIVVGGWLAHNGTDLDSAKKVTRRTAVFTTCVMGVICLSSATIALLNRSTAFEVQHMLGLGFTITPLGLLGIIVIGGMGLLVVQWWVTILSVKWIYRYFLTHALSPND